MLLSSQESGWQIAAMGAPAAIALSTNDWLEPRNAIVGMDGVLASESNLAWGAPITIPGTVAALATNSRLVMVLGMIISSFCPRDIGFGGRLLSAPRL